MVRGFVILHTCRWGVCISGWDSGLGSWLNAWSITSLVPFRPTPSHRKSKPLAVSCYNAQCHAQCHALCDTRNGSSIDIEVTLNIYGFITAFWLMPLIHYASIGQCMREMILRHGRMAWLLVGLSNSITTLSQNNIIHTYLRCTRENQK